MSRHPFRTPPPEIARDTLSLTRWIQSEHPKMPLRKAQRIAEIQAARAGATALKEEWLERLAKDS